MPYADPQKGREMKQMKRLRNLEACRAADKARYWRDRDARRPFRKALREKNKETTNLRRKAYYHKHRERIRQYNARYVAAHKAQIQQYRIDTRTKRAAYERERRRVCPQRRLSVNLRVRIWHAVKGRAKAARTLELLGCTIPELRTHLEQKFQPGMTWENYGLVWEIDHIRPCAEFDLSDPLQQRVCFHHLNLQPLSVEDNQKKGAKVCPTNSPPSLTKT